MTRVIIMLVVVLGTMTSCVSRSAESQQLRQATEKAEKISENHYKLNQWYDIESDSHAAALLASASDAFYISRFQLKSYNSEDEISTYLSSDGVYAVYNVPESMLTLYRHTITIE